MKLQGRNLSQRMNGDDVKLLHQELQQLGYALAGPTVLLIGGTEQSGREQGWFSANSQRYYEISLADNGEKDVSHVQRYRLIKNSTTKQGAYSGHDYLSS